ncbi:hypothetical protein [Candidatus Poriferisodalis sp.]|uniref:hypothetical protein n=1 Tax=Candidatus Poriferisodalis sp. TaxID=3101277 RepID=UPI003B51CC8B
MRHHTYRQARGDPPHFKRWRAVAASLAVCTLGALTPVSAHASPTTDGGPETNPVVASYASDYSVTLAEAQQRLERIPELQEIIAALHEAESERLAGWGIDHHGPMIAWVWLTGTEPPTSAATAIAAAHDDVQVRTGATVTFAALAAAQDRFGIGEGIGAVGNTGAVGGTQVDLSDMIAHTAVNLRANALEIGIDTAAAAPEPSGALDSADERTPIGPLGTVDDLDSPDTTLAHVAQLIAPHINVPFNVIEADPVEDQAAFEGGRRMGRCTSGFAAQHRGTGRYGMITAGHCDSTSWSTQGVTLTRAEHAYNSTMDAAFYTIPQAQSHQVTNQVVCVNDYATQDTCSIRSVGPSRLRMMDVPVCHSGDKSGVSCGTVDHIRYRPRLENGCDGHGGNCSAVFGRAAGPGMKACKGDSGGPVYSFSTAYGIHKGGPKDNPCTAVNSWISFSAIRDVRDDLNVNVITFGPINVP